MEYQDFCWVDTAFNGVRNRNKLVMLKDLRIPSTGKDHYCTYYRYSNDFVNYFKANNESVSRFKGKCFADYLPIDIDDKNIKVAHDTTIRVLETLKNVYDVNLGDLRIFFSGSKGFHIMIPTSMIAASPSEKLPVIFKNMASEILQGVDFDKTIYDITRLFRLPNTLNSKANRYKIPLTLENVLELTTDEILNMSVSPNKVEFTPTAEISVNDELNALYEEIKNRVPEKKEIVIRKETEINYESLSNHKLCYHKMMTEGAIDGSRDNTALRLATHYRKMGYSTEVVHGIMEGWNKIVQPPLDDSSKFVKQAFENNYDYGCNDEILQMYCDKKCYLSKTIEVNDDNIYSLADLEKKYKKYIEELDKRKISIGIPKIDKAIRGIAPGEVMQVMARSGVGKTAFMLNIMQNVCKLNVPTLFFSLEMQGEQIFERMAQISSCVSGVEVETKYKSKSPDVKLIQEIMSRGYNNVYVVDQDFLKMEDILNYIVAAERKTGLKFGAIFIDYMGRMKGVKGSEYEVISELARQLKYVAKKTDKAIISLHQLNRTGGVGDSEVSMDMARGSGVVEEAADQILGLFRPDCADHDTMKNPQEQINIQILKNRKGALGMHQMILDKPRLKFYEIEDSNLIGKPAWVHSADEIEKNQTKMEVIRNDKK